MDPELQEALLQAFPALRSEPFTVTSPATEDYNRQLPSGEWTSKLGRDVDITHTLAGLKGDSYGKPVVFLGRPSTGAKPYPVLGWLPPTTT
jgi:hypothetical protein